MNEHDMHDAPIDLGVASVETQGIPGGTGELGVQARKSGIDPE